MTTETVTPKNLNDQLTITIVVRRKTHNGITVKDYANGVTNGIYPVLTHDEFIEWFGASDTDISSVIDYVQQAGLTVSHAESSSASVIATGTIGQINSLFGIIINDVVTPQRTYINYTGTITVPDNLKDVIQHVDGLDTSYQPIPSIRPDPLTATATSGYSTPLVTPQKAATAYGFPGKNDGTDGEGQVIALIEPFGSGGYTTQNLTSTFATYGVSVPTVVPVTLDGTTNDPTGSASDEVMLDIAMVGGIVPKATIVVYFCTNFSSAMAEILSPTGYKPQTVSMSFGGPENLSAKYAPNSPQYIAYSIQLNSYDTQIASAVSLGITMIASSGDFGPYNNKLTNEYRINGACWPASNPNVLAVGGTSLALNPNGTIASEVIWNNREDCYISGGNQSTRYSVPTWQSGITLKNYATGISSAPTGRAVPDVAFVGDPYTGFTFNYYLNGSNQNYQYTYGGGTSAAAPLWAGLIARINQLNGKPSGFLNSKFYNNPGAFNDILPTSVANNNAYLGVGFSTTVGWDATTGLGSPKGLAVYNVLAQGTTKIKTNSTTWSPVKNVQVKSDSGWTNVSKIYVKTSTGWSQTYTL